MVKYGPEKISEIRDRVRLEEWVGRTVQLQKRGHRWVGLCPFHSEKTPSFGVSPSKQLFHCFGCGVGGDVFAYVMRLEGLDFPAAVKLLAEAHGIELPNLSDPADPAQQQRTKHNQQLYNINAVAQEAFRTALRTDKGARQYLTHTRGLSPESINHFEIGWALPEWSALTNTIRQAQLPVELALEIGLLGRRASDNKPYDRLRAKVTFPIRLPNGRIAGFGARRADWIDNNGPKYLNSPESSIYDKSTILYGLHLARDSIRKMRQALLVEGYLDVIGLVQAGFTNTVASCGTALTTNHAKTLARLTTEVVTIYDGDTAGLRATLKTAELLLAAGTEVRVVPLPNGSDPDDFVRNNGREALEEAIRSAPSAIDFFLHQARATHAGGGVAGAQKAIDTVRPLLESIADPFVRDIAFDACARELGIDRRTLNRHLGQRRYKVSPRNAPNVSHPHEEETLSTNSRSAPLPHIVEVELLKMLLEEPKTVLNALDTHGAREAFVSTPLKCAVDGVANAIQSEQSFSGPEALDIMRDQGLIHEPWLQQVRAHLVMSNEPEAHDLDTLIERLKRNYRHVRIQALQQQIDRCTNADEHTRLLEEVVRVQLGEL
ncbi:MAG: DNA primase [Myxococcales bacterium]|nr:DNA primase [Myxococcales bacterium]